MAPNSPEYTREYALKHKERIRRKQREWYLANKAKILAHQKEYRDRLKSLRAASRASQKPVRKQVRRLLPAVNDSSRMLSTQRGPESAAAGEHAGVVPQVSRAGPPAGNENE